MRSNAIWILGDLRTGRLWKASLQVLAKALVSAEALNAPVSMILMGPAHDRRENVREIDPPPCMSMKSAAAQAVAHGAAKVRCITHDDLAVPRTDVYAGVMADLVMAETPWLVIMLLNDFGRETAAFCARKCTAGLIADCEQLILTEGKVVGRCPAWGGQIMADITLAQGWSTAFVTMQSHGIEPTSDPQADGRIEHLSPAHVKIPKGLRLKERRLAPRQAYRLERAQTVVVGGAGLGDRRGFGLVRDLAAALGAQVGATRPPVRQHWVNEERLIGQTGKTVRPKLLMTIGTSGAIQYTAGIMEAQTIVAINRDPSAPIFDVADIGVVGEADTVLPLLIQRAQHEAFRQLTDTACLLEEETDGQRGGFGEMVRRLREARNWSAAELARKTGQTPDFISQVETDQMSPPVGFIMRMAQAMGIDPDTFLNTEQRQTIRDRHAQEHYQRIENDNYESLTPESENSRLRAFMVTIEPHAPHQPVAYKHEGEEFIFVITGEMELTLGSKTHNLKSGASIHFNSDVPHKLKSISNDPTRCLVVLNTL